MSRYDIAVVLVVALVIVAVLVILLVFVAQGGLNMMSLLQTQAWRAGRGVM